jgi:hypothetical protein
MHCEDESGGAGSCGMTTDSSSVALLYTSRHTVRERSDVVVPEYKRRSKAGEVFFNPLIEREVVGRQKPATCRFVYDYDPPDDPYFHKQTEVFPFTVQGWAIEPLGAATLPVEGEDIFNRYSDEFDSLILEAHANVQENVAELLATLGEMPETLHWLASVLRRANALLRAARKRDYETMKQIMLLSGRRYRHRNARPLDSFTDWWLGFRYAFRPLFFEMDAILKALQKRTIEKRGTGRAYDSSVVVNEKVVDDSRVTNGYGYVVTTSDTRVCTFRTGVLYSIDGNIPLLTTAFGLDRPLQALYELVPFSFILDWFYSVGDWIGWLSRPGYLKQLGSWGTLSYVENRRLDSTHIDGGYPGSNGRYYSYTSVNPGYFEMVNTWKIRQPNLAVPSFPVFRLNLNISKILDLVLIGRKLLH